MKRLAVATALIVGLLAPLAAEACTATGYVITVIIPGNFPTAAATVYVRHPTLTGAVTSAFTTNLAIISAASAAVTGEQRVLMATNAGGAGVCLAGGVGGIASLALRP